MIVMSSFLHFEHTPALDEKINEASTKMGKFFDSKGIMKWSCFVKGNLHIAEVNYQAPGCSYHAKGVSDNMYESIDLALSKIEKQVFKKKEKFNKLHRGKIELLNYCS